MSDNQKHTILPMIVLKQIQQGDWYGYYSYYLDMDGYNSILFSNIHCSHGRNISQSCNRMDPLHRKAYHHRHFAVRRPGRRSFAAWKSRRFCSAATMQKSPNGENNRHSNEQKKTALICSTTTIKIYNHRNLLPTHNIESRLHKHPVPSSWNIIRWRKFHIFGAYFHAPIKESSAIWTV